MSTEERRERTLKLVATDEEWAKFTESIPRDWHDRFEKLAACMGHDLEKNRPERLPEVSYRHHIIQDCRANHPEAYKTKHRRGQFVRSWDIGVKQRNDGSKSIGFSDGITWGSIGQIFGYLFGEMSKEQKDQIYQQLLDAYPATDHGAPMWIGMKSGEES